MLADFAPLVAGRGHSRRQGDPDGTPAIRLTPLPPNRPSQPLPTLLLLLLLQVLTLLPFLLPLLCLRLRQVQLPIQLLPRLPLYLNLPPLILIYPYRKDILRAIREFVNRQGAVLHLHAAAGSHPLGH